MSNNSNSSPLATFLDSAKSDFLHAINEGQDLSNWVLCTGNEAGDLDSLASSIAFSYFSTTITTNTNTTTSKRHIPLMQTHSTDLYLRPENLYALSSASISLSSLLCIDQVPGEILQRAPSDGGPSYALVDHNVLLPSLRASNSTEDQVVAILDHHVDESSHLSASPRTIQPVGSCVSLIAQHFLVDLDPSSTDVPSGLADLILSSILIDTGLKPTTSGGKATQVDLTAVQILLPFASPLFSSTPSPSSSSISTQTTEPFAGLMAVNKILGEKKFSVDHLGGRDLLRRDYKEYQLDDDDQTIRYGLSTIPLPLSNWLTKEVEGKSGWDLVLQEVEDWKKERGLDMAAILTSFDLSPDHPLRVGGKKLGGMGKHARELLVHVGGDSNSGHGKKGKMQGLFQGLEEEGSLQLGEWKGAIALGEEGFKGGQGWRVWQQGNVKATRKQVAPVIKALLQSL